MKRLNLVLCSVLAVLGLVAAAPLAAATENVKDEVTYAVTAPNCSVNLIWPPGPGDVNLDCINITAGNPFSGCYVTLPWPPGPGDVHLDCLPQFNPGDCYVTLPWPPGPGNVHLDCVQDLVG